MRATCGPQKPCKAKRGPGTSASEALGRALARTTAKRGHKATKSTPARSYYTSGLGLGLGLGLGSPSWFTRLVLQHPFRSQGRENILAASSSSSSSSNSSKQQQAATELSSAYPHISINIDRTSPKLSWYIVLMMPYNHTKFQVKTKGQGRWAKKS